MATHVKCQTPIPLAGVTSVAYNSNNTRIATCDGHRIVVRGSIRPENMHDRRLASSGSYVPGNENITSGEETNLDSEWDVSSMVVESTSGTVTVMEWLGVEHGNVLVCGTDTGVVLVYSEDPDECRDGCAAAWYGMRDVLRYSTSAVTCMKAVDLALSVGGGPVVAVGYNDGTIRLFEYCGGGSIGIGWKGRSPIGIDDETQKTLWSVHSVISCPVSLCRACLCIDIKYGREAVTVLVAGYEGCGAPQLYAYDAMSFMWQHVDMDVSLFSGTGVDAVAWAPLMGREHDLIAVATGSDVTLWSVSGPLDDMHIERVAVLNHDTDVWQLGWNVTGTWLAASTDANMVCLWRPDLGGEWKLLHTIEGMRS